MNGSTLTENAGAAGGEAPPAQKTTTTRKRGRPPGAPNKNKTGGGKASVKNRTAGAFAGATVAPSRGFSGDSIPAGMPQLGMPLAPIAFMGDAWNPGLVPWDDFEREALTQFSGMLGAYHGLATASFPALRS